MQLHLNNVSHYHGKTPILYNLNLELEAGEIGALIGPSGAGKTTLLSCIAGLEAVSGGEITIGAKLMSSPDTHVPAEKRSVGMMFQDAALFPHLSVRDNIAFGLKGPQDAQRKRVEELAATCEIADKLAARPHELSGGQQQRVSLARALAPRPRLLLLDEPFSNSDALMRTKLIKELAAILAAEGTTALFVTHDQEDAFAIADRCGVIDGGSICQWDSAYNLYHRPNCAFVANFVGDGILLDAKLTSEHELSTELGVISAAGKLTTPLLQPGEPVKLFLRPDDIVLANGRGVPAEVTERSFRGADIIFTLRTRQGTHLYTVLPSRQNMEIGAQVSVAPEVEHVVIFPTVA